MHAVTIEKEEMVSSSNHGSSPEKGGVALVNLVPYTSIYTHKHHVGKPHQLHHGSIDIGKRKGSRWEPWLCSIDGRPSVDSPGAGSYYDTLCLVQCSPSTGTPEFSFVRVFADTEKSLVDPGNRPRRHTGHHLCPD